MSKAQDHSAFPIFDDGDVEFRLTRNPKDRYVVHSVVLSIHSSFFKASLSKQWTPLSSEPTAESSPKWVYELQFRVGSADGFFVKVQNTAVIDSVNANTTADTAAIYLSATPWAPWNDDLTASRLQSIEAHRQFLNILYHQPPSLPTKDFDSAFALITNIIDTADEYCALPVVSWHMENHLARHFPTNTLTFCIDKPRPALELALTLKSSWLFREVAGRLIGSPSFDDAALTTRFSDLALVPWLLSKRADLRALIQATDTALLTLHITDISGPNTLDLTVALAVFRDLIIRHYNADRWESPPHHPRRPQWATYARLYRIVAHFDTHWSHADILTLLAHSGLGDRVDPARFARAFRVLMACAARAVAPLLATTVSEDGVKRRGPLTRGFTCVEIGEAELPWVVKGI